MSHRPDPTVGQHGDPKPPRILGHFIHSSGLGTTDRHHFLRDADRTAAHPDSQRVGARVDEVLGLGSGHYVARDDLEETRSNDRIQSRRMATLLPPKLAPPKYYSADDNSNDHENDGDDDEADDAYVSHDDKDDIDKVMMILRWWPWRW